ncbi:MAG: hypothetical protein CO021_06045 [Deltaproteobacteria bacterium CG_4_9_14_0_2_um_filter_42_21]|nr:MAG: hypothetical protein CO021_06045 [Deltaproteobacteria bacterium CG_4_9_14_0_2_um_filter_42_21]
MSPFSVQSIFDRKDLASSFPSAMLQELQQTGLITNEHEFFAGLQTVGESVLPQLALSESELRNGAKTFSFIASSGETLSLDLHFFSSRDLSDPNVVLYRRFVSERGDLLAIFASTIFRDENGKQGSEIVVVEKNMRRNNLPGFGRAFMDFYNRFNRLLQLDYEYIRAAWLGRKVWTQLGDFQFYQRYSFLVDGKMMSQREVVASNFERFLAHHNIDQSALCYQVEVSEISFSEAKQNNLIQKPADYLRIVNVQGKKISIAPLVDYQVLGQEQALDIGEAFVLSDNRPYETQSISVQFVRSGIPLNSGNVWPPNNHFSDRAMPPWVGVREFVHASV